MLVASGYESRARELAIRLNASEVTLDHRVAWGFAEHADNPVRKINDEALSAAGYEIRILEKPTRPLQRVGLLTSFQNFLMESLKF